ncbi:hypothetical protein, partial [Pseudomonas corrugata]|uniref:hypothetical protein n=1 Tax=Pseudomonas corrugata TaxID=47879 RepID=UPI001C2FE0AE
SRNQTSRKATRKSGLFCACYFCACLQSASLQKFCNYFLPKGLVTWLDTPILSRIAQEVIDARKF